MKKSAHLIQTALITGVLLTVSMIRMFSGNVWSNIGYEETGNITITDSGTENHTEPDAAEASGSGQNYGYIDNGLRIESVEENNGLLRSSTPSGYDLRNSAGASYVTPVKDQGIYGTCWAFAIVAAAESNLVKTGLKDSSIDLSEYHLSYFHYNTVADSLGGTAGDFVLLLSADKYPYLTKGGDYFSATYTLAKWIGFAEESISRYPDAADTPQKPDNGIAYSDVAHMQNAYWISMEDKDIIKQMIMTRGAVAVSYYHNYKYLNSAANSYYCFDPIGYANHGVVIVGWDDNYPRTNFTVQPASNGAWLIKNSWGSSFGDQGFFWISYEDSVMKTSTAFSFESEKADNYDCNYQYDGGVSTAYMEFTDTCMISNVFSVHGSSGNDESLQAVSFLLKSVNTEYRIQIYKNPMDEANPASGTKMLDIPQTGTALYAGYHTVKLHKPVILGYGDRFAVVIELKKTGGTVSFCYDYDNSTNLWIDYNAYSEKGQSFYSSNGGLEWTDLSAGGKANIRLKAFTAIADKIDIAGATVDPIGSRFYTGSQITPEVTVRYGKNMLIKDVDYTISYSNNTAVGTATAVLTGIRGYMGNKSTEFQIVPVRTTGVGLDITSTTIGTIGSSVQLTAAISPADATDRRLVWSSGDLEIAVVDGTGKVTAAANGKTTITVTTADGGFTAACEVSVNDRIISFVERLYEKVLERIPGRDETAYYWSALKDGSRTGAEVGWGFVFSSECRNRNLNNAGYVGMLYETFLNRQPDMEGIEYWTGLLDNGVSREYVFKKSVESEEYEALCSASGIVRGYIILTEPGNQNAELTMFICSLYREILGRDAEKEGLNYYAGEILAKRMTLVEASKNFIFSPEFENRKVPDTEYVKILYRAFMDREFDQPGLDFHMKRMEDGTSRAEILDGFAYSPEFYSIVKKFE